MSVPKVSVVMSLYNGAETLKNTIDSILSQTFKDFEFIIINDGSSDESSLLLSSLNNLDSRIKVFSQKNIGLTKSLINGCRLAKGKYIARQDNGDYSYPKRLEQQVKYLEQNQDTVMVSTATAFVGPQQEELYTVIQSQHDAETGLTRGSVSTFEGPPHHGSVMFRRSDYDAVGGYREEFKVAQDIDLWSRLIEHGKHYSLSDILYTAAVAKGSISMLRRDAQQLATQAVIDCSQSRKKTGDDTEALADYVTKSINNNSVENSAKKTDAAYYYFLGANLQNKNIKASHHYFKLAIASNPFHGKALIRLLMSVVQNVFKRTEKH